MLLQMIACLTGRAQLSALQWNGCAFPSILLVLPALDKSYCLHAIPSHTLAHGKEDAFKGRKGIVSMIYSTILSLHTQSYSDCDTDKLLDLGPNPYTCLNLPVWTSRLASKGSALVPIASHCCDLVLARVFTQGDREAPKGAPVMLSRCEQHNSM